MRPRGIQVTVVSIMMGLKRRIWVLGLPHKDSHLLSLGMTPKQRRRGRSAFRTLDTNNVLWRGYLLCLVESLMAVNIVSAS